jgi:class 3 adenylate cyclase
MPAAPEEPAKEPGRDHPAHLLVADDDEMNRDMLARRLRSYGYEVDSAADGVEALEAIEKGAFDLLLLDVMMPRMDGIETLSGLRSSRGLADLPVIMATALGDSHTIVEALRLGANDYVTKPLDFPVVLARVQTQLALKRQKDEIQRLAEDLEVRNRFIRNTFGRYLSDEIVNALLESPEGLKLGGEKRTVTIMMSDLRAFTSVSERLGPESVVNMLNRYLGDMTEIIMKYNGTIDEIIGDAILTIFGAPMKREDDAARACACAIEMQAAMGGLNKELVAQGLPPLEMGLAIHTGEVVVGNIGSQRRTKYAVVGPPVNLTGRIESYTVGGQILVSETTMAQVKAELKLGDLVEVKAKGAKEPIRVHDLQGIGAPYSVFLAAREEHYQPLQPSVDLRYYVLEGKSVGEKAYVGQLSKLSEHGGEISSEASLPPLSNIKIALQKPDGSDVGGDLYAKVLEVRGEDGRALILRFTAVGPEAEAFLKPLRPAPAGH